MKRLRMAAAFLACGMLVADCASDGTAAGGVDFYGGFYYDDWWYGAGGCCVDYPGDIGPPPPRPEHPIALPPTDPPKPAHPIATPPSRPATPSRPMPSPRAVSMPRGGGGRR
jgi:hypothetical protein